MRILVVEDDPLVAQTLQILLSCHNYAVDIAADGEAGWQMADAFDYDLIVLDVFLPKLDGLHLCKRLRDRGYQMPILLLTGQSGSHEKAVALNNGADDYVVKPFHSEELIARIQALLRRGTIHAAPVLQWENLHLTPSNRHVTYGSHLLSLTPKEYAILELLLRHPQQIFSSRAILDHAWTATEAPGEEAVRTHIKGLRQKLKAATAPTDLIETVHGVGYRLKSLEARSSDLSDLPPTVLIVAADQERLHEWRSQLAPQSLRIQLLQSAAADPTGLWHRLETDPPDVLLLDVEVPSAPSLHLCQQIHHAPPWRDLPIILLLPPTEAELVHHVFAAGAADFVRKPIVESELVARILNQVEQLQHPSVAEA